ncbi:SMP-30/gluconolactonase/LRE family protein [Rhizobium sp. SL86]|uniref:SMP-30/gluconolactonase/LRE family protein n=1 Tax=Rhizobium sp. SL86 TaxID=2995148 RepID=UPI002273C750|nr:SMP-30/gluconolactonase/LRE family protein [Rhizobium sp. SL86]MCY1667287.1 SMP-30/gluconolactonase/LRE family protein [Rhizobium sp. SL86]
MTKTPGPLLHQAHRIAEPDCTIAETPVWDAKTGQVTWVDTPGGAVYRYTLSDGKMERFALSLKVGSMALVSSGRFIASTERGFAIMTIGADGLEFDAGFGPQLTGGWRMNDGACDRQGRFWSGTMAPDTSAPDAWGSLHSIDRHAVVTDRGGQFRSQNGLAWSPDSRTMYVSDSHPSNPHILAYDFDADTGRIFNGRLFADQAALGGRPDGAAIDTDGCYWIAASDSGRIVRMTPEGRIDAEIHVDVPNPTNICFVGPDLRSAFITTLKAGGVGPGGAVYLVEDLPYQGLAEPTFRCADDWPAPSGGTDPR